MQALIKARVDAILAATAEEAAKWAAASDKEIGLALKTIPDPARSFIFAHRKGQMNEDRTRQALFRMVRPVGNDLPGYTPSYGLRRAAEEMVG
jgi:RNA ligase